jgi:hypothetical protein
MRLGAVTTVTNADGSVTITDSATGIVTTAYSDGSAQVFDPMSGTTTNYGSTQNLVQAVGATPVDSSWLSTLTDALPKLATFINAQQLAQINVQRAQRGQPALDAGQYGPQVGLSMTAGSMGPVLMLAGAALLIALLMSGRRRG